MYIYYCTKTVTNILSLTSLKCGSVPLAEVPNPYIIHSSHLNADHQWITLMEWRRMVLSVKGVFGEMGVGKLYSVGVIRLLSDFDHVVRDIPILITDVQSERYTPGELDHHGST